MKLFLYKTSCLFVDNCLVIKILTTLDSRLTLQNRSGTEHHLLCTPPSNITFELRGFTLSQVRVQSSRICNDHCTQDALRRYSLAMRMHARAVFEGASLFPTCLEHMAPVLLLEVYQHTVSKTDCDVQVEGEMGCDWWRSLYK